MLIAYITRSKKLNRTYLGSASDGPAEVSKHNKSLLLLVSSVLMFITIPIFFAACDLPHQPGPMPTDIVETEFEPGLNIMGVLRADDQRGSSFININRILTTEEIYSDTIENFSPPVDYARVRSLGTPAEYFFFKSDTVDWENYKDSSLLVFPGETYDLEISAPGFPTLTAATIVPNKPEVVEGSIIIASNNISFQIQHHASVFEYKLYLFFTESILEKVVKPVNGELIDISWNFSNDRGTPIYLMLSALDENLTSFGNSPISFIPNTYHPDGSTVDGGYGCFGSVSISTYELN